MKAKTSNKSTILLFFVFVYLFFTACTNTISTKLVQTTPEQPEMKDTMENTQENSAYESSATKTVVEINNENKPEVSNTPPVPAISKVQSQLDFTTSKSSITLDAGESTEITVLLENKSNQEEENVEIYISGFEGKGILKSNEKLSKRIAAILPDQKMNVIFPIEINTEIEGSTLSLNIFMSKGQEVKPSVITIKATCRSKEERLYNDIHQKSRIKIEKRIEMCLEYLEKYQDGRYSTIIKSLLENLRWEVAQKVYRQSVSAMNVEKEAYAQIERIYLAHYGLNGRYSKDSAKMLYELRDFQKACIEDNFEAYRKFKEIYSKSLFSQVAAQRMTLNYWKQREAKAPGNSHIWCQVAQAIMEEKGTLGYREAKEYFIRTIDADKYNKAAYIGLGKILKAYKEWDTCVQYLDSKKPPEVGNHEVYYLLGHAYECKNNQAKSCYFYTKAIQNIEKEIKRDITIINQDKYLSTIAKKTAIVKIKTNPDYLKYLYYRALMYRVIPDFARAKKDFSKIIEIDPASQWAKTAIDYLNGMR
jgi:tetratricopeptide (TPR) repeat protein